MTGLVGGCGVILTFAPVAVVASAVEGHRRGWELVVLVEAHGLAPVGGPTIVYVVVVSTRSDLVADCPGEANTLGATKIVKAVNLLLGLLGEVRLECLAEGTEALL